MKKTVLITGALSGIGKATARIFAGNRWNVVATMHAPAKETELAGLGDVLVTRLDVRDRGSVGQAIEAGISRLGKIDAPINNAGFGQYGLFEAVPWEKVQEQFDVNVFGAMDITRAIPAALQEKGMGQSCTARPPTTQAYSAISSGTILAFHPGKA